MRKSHEKTKMHFVFILIFSNKRLAYARTRKRPDVKVFTNLLVYKQSIYLGYS